MNWSALLGLKAFSPNADPTTPGVLVDATDLIPSDRGWRAAYSLSNQGMDTLTATCVGAALIVQADGSYALYAGTASQLFRRSANTWTELTPTATAVAATSDLRWRFAALGEYVLAASTSNTIVVSASGATFTSITGAPKAALVEAANGFVMAADTNDATYGDQSDRWWCSGLFDHTDWTPALETQCTTGRLVDTPGPIRALRRLGRNFIAYKDSSLYLGEYVQPPVVWQWSLISSDVGCPSQDAVCNIGRAHLFMSNRNFHLYDGAQIADIGDPIREWFFGTQLLRAYDNRVQSVHDWRNGLVYWFYPVAASTGALTQAVVYSYRADRWGVASYAVEAAVEYVAAAITYDTLGDYYATFDAGIDRTYDSPLWIPDTVGPAVIDSAHLLRGIDGASAGCRFKTGHLGDDQAFSLLRRVRVRWLTAPGSARLDLYTQDEHGSAFTLRTANVAQAGNRFDLLASARWHQLEITTTGDTEFTGLSVDVQPQGAW